MIGLRNSNKALALVAGGFVALLAASYTLTALFSERVAFLITFAAYLVLMVLTLRKGAANDTTGRK